MAEAFGKLEITATWPVLPSATVLPAARLEFEPLADIAAGITTIGVPGGTTLVAVPALLVGMLAVTDVVPGETLAAAGEALAALDEPLEPVVPGIAPFATLVAVLSALPN